MKSVLWILVAGCVACSGEEGDGGGGAAAAQPAGPAPQVLAPATVYSYLETREHVITLHVGELYSVKQKDGTVLASEIDDATLERDFPELHAMIHDAADDGGELIMEAIGYSR